MEPGKLPFQLTHPNSNPGNRKITLGGASACREGCRDSAFPLQIPPPLLCGKPFKQEGGWESVHFCSLLLCLFTEFLWPLCLAVPCEKVWDMGRDSLRSYRPIRCIRERNERRILRRAELWCYVKQSILIECCIFELFKGTCHYYKRGGFHSCRKRASGDLVFGFLLCCTRGGCSCLRILSFWQSFGKGSQRSPEGAEGL